MDDLFSDLRDDSFEEVESPTFETPEPVSPGFDDEFERLRNKSARTGSTYDEMDTSVDDAVGDGSGFSLGNFSASQKLILLALLLLDIVAVGFGLLILMGRI